MSRPPTEHPVWAHLRGRLKILHDPKYLIHWELGYYSILRSCRIFSINSISLSVIRAMNCFAHALGASLFSGIILMSPASCLLILSILSPKNRLLIAGSPHQIPTNGHLNLNFHSCDICCSIIEVQHACQTCSGRTSEIVVSILF